jgi:hypothetical protein
MKINDKSKSKLQGVTVRYMDVGEVYKRVGTESYWMKTNDGGIVCLCTGVTLSRSNATDTFRFLRANAELVVHGVKS